MPRKRSLGPGFAALWTATGAANLADGVYLFALPLVALRLTDSPALVAGVTTMLTIAWPLFGLQAGVIVDRVDRRKLLIVVNVVRAAALAVLGFALTLDSASIALVYCVALILGLGETLVDTGLTSMVPMIVGKDDLGRANARVEGTQNIANQFVGPPLAGLLAAFGLAMATGVSGFLYVVAVASLAVLRGSYRPAPTNVVDPVPGEASAARLWRTVIVGLTFTWRHALLRPLTIMTAAMNVCWAAWTALLVIYAVAPGPMGLTEPQYGLLLTMMAVGGLAGAVVVEPLRRRIGTRPVLALDVIGTMLLLGVPGLTTNVVAIGAAVLMGGLGSAVWRVIGASIRQIVVPGDMLGRVYSANRVISWGVLPIGSAVGGLGAEFLGVRTVFLLGGFMGALLIVIFVRVITPERLALASVPPARPGVEATNDL